MLMIIPPERVAMLVPADYVYGDNANGKKITGLVTVDTYSLYLAMRKYRYNVKNGRYWHDDEEEEKEDIKKTE